MSAVGTPGARLRLVLLLAGLGALVTGAPVSALVDPPSLEQPTTRALGARGLPLLEAAVRQTRTLSWSGTQHVMSLRGGQPRLSVLDVRHLPGRGSTVRVLSSQDQALTAEVLDARVLVLLASHYDLQLGPLTVCAGRAAQLVEAVRPGWTGPSAVAGRFWVDRATGLVLRRDVLDLDGALVRTSAFVSLQVGAAHSTLAEISRAAPAGPAGEHLGEAALTSLEADGWTVPRTLPSGLELFEARWHVEDGGEVLQLSYSDGLSTLSLFAQKGELSRDTAGIARPVGSGTVWVSPGATERVVWATRGRTWTLVSDAPETAVEQTLLALAPAQAAPAGDGMLHRTWRGMSRVGSWLNPFD